MQKWLKAMFDQGAPVGDDGRGLKLPALRAVLTVYPVRPSVTTGVD